MAISLFRDVPKVDLELLLPHQQVILLLLLLSLLLLLWSNSSCCCHTARALPVPLDRGQLRNIGPHAHLRSRRCLLGVHPVASLIHPPHLEQVKMPHFQRGQFVLFSLLGACAGWPLLYEQARYLQTVVCYI